MAVSYIKRTHHRVVREQPRIRHLDSGASMYDRRWRTQSLAFLKCYPFCVLCLCLGTINECADHNTTDTRSLVVDHIVPHQGDVNLFWDQSNWQTLGKHHHDRDKQQCDRMGRDWFALLRGVIKEKQTHAFVMQHAQWIPNHVMERLQCV